jgi:hypothetical protein
VSLDQKSQKSDMRWQCSISRKTREVQIFYRFLTRKDGDFDQWNGSLRKSVRYEIGDCGLTVGLTSGWNDGFGDAKIEYEQGAGDGVVLF